MTGPQIEQMLLELGARVKRLQEIGRGDADETWTTWDLLIADDDGADAIPVTVAHAREERTLILAASLEAPQSSPLETIAPTLLRMNSIWSETGGMILAIGAEDEIEMTRHLVAVDLDPVTLGKSIEDFAARALSLATMLEQGTLQVPDASPEGEDHFEDYALRV